MKIPNQIHFCFGLEEDFGRKPFSFVHFLSVKSAWLVNRPRKMTFHYKFEPTGQWWERAKKYLHLSLLEPPASIWGKPLNHYAHKSDVIRLEALIRDGGIYLDLDVVCLKSFEPLLSNEFVMGRQSDRGLCNAVILSSPGAEFATRWHEAYRSFRSLGRDEFWDEHSVILPSQMAVLPELKSRITILDEFSFFWPTWKLPEVLWGTNEQDFSRSYCIHLWESIWWEEHLRDLNPETLRRGESNFYRLVQESLKDEDI